MTSIRDSYNKIKRKHGTLEDKLLAGKITQERYDYLKFKIKEGAEYKKDVDPIWEERWLRILAKQYGGDLKGYLYIVNKVDILDIFEYSGIQSYENMKEQEN